MQKSKPDYYNDLDKTYSKIWDLLKKGLLNRNSPFHIPVFISCINNKTDGRIVVLRGVDEKNKKLWFHSDIRSNKIKTLKDNSKSNFLFYDKEEKIQLKIFVTSKIQYNNSTTKKAWGKTAHMSRQCYLGNQPPGKESSKPTSGLTEDIDNSKYTIQESEIGYKNFCVIENFIETIEWLYLASKGHRRGFFLLNNDDVDKKWLIP